MQFKVVHSTHYHYGQPVTLQPHIIRLHPRTDAAQTVRSFQLTITPEPLQMSPVIDLDGNHLLKVWFNSAPVTSLVVQTEAEILTHRTNPFDFLLEPWAAQLPWDYPLSWLGQLQPYLMGQPPNHARSLDPTAIALAHDLCHDVNGHPLQFLSELNQRIYHSCQHLIRDTGDPFLPSITWAKQAGSCRDFTVLFMEVCRAIGIAARFVSGYQAGDPDASERHLHAWAEVYLPGAGWRGYDPTHGLAVSEGHVALVASAIPSHAAPVTGAVAPGGVPATLDSTLTMQVTGSA